MASPDVLTQAATAFAPGNRRAMWISLPFGGMVPWATFDHAHKIVGTMPFWEQGAFFLAAGGLVYSGLTVFGWARSTLLVDCTTSRERLGATLKAAGFVLLSEGTLVHSDNDWLVGLVLAILVAVNAIAAQSMLIRAREMYEQFLRKQKKAAAAAEKRAVAQGKKAPAVTRKKAA